MNLKTTALAAVFCLSTSIVLPAQTTSSTTKKPASTSGGDLFEVNIFGGAHFFKRQNDPPSQDLVNGGLVGFRFVQNFWNYVSLEQTGMVHGTANVEYRIPGTGQDYALGARLRQFHFNPVLHLKPREARVRPFLTMGFGLAWFGVTDAARAQVGNGVNTPFRQLVNLESMFRTAFNYGGGVKAKVTDRVGLRFDMRGFATAASDFGVPVVGPGPSGTTPGAILYTRTTPFNALQTTAGLTFYLGPIDQGPVCEFRVGSIEPGASTIWLTESSSYKIGVTNNCLGVTPKYRWTVDGAPVAGDDMIAVRGLKPGDSAIKVAVEADTTKVTDRKTRNFLKKFPIAAVERTASLTVKKPSIELVSVALDPETINYNGTSEVTSTIRYDGPSAGEDVLVIYEISEGRLTPVRPTQTVSGGLAAMEAAAKANPNQAIVSPDGRTAVEQVKLRPGNTRDSVRFDASGVRVTPGGPSKKIDVDVTVKDQSGNVIARKKPASGGPTVMAPPAPPPPPAAPPKLNPMQLDDVIFTRNAARVNNCGKRVIDQAFERAASMGEYDVLLVGHFDAVEKNFKVRDRKSRTTRSLDEERVLNVAAVLSAGVEPCKRLSRDRIKVAYVGAEQLSPFKTSLCEATVKERGGSKISVRDGNAKNRRVEIWLVPKSGPMPNGIGGIQNAPASNIESKGCPK
jgi:outer membrane protein OmpA-like peptidoglycan-associated protein/opacity protein-like surface antigen